jgi:site-specific DNA-methyltransferase (adenine-specific)
MEVLATLAPDSIDACVTDPPYGINFMGKKWDKFDGDNRSWADFQGTVGIDHKKTRERRASMQAGSYDLSPKAMHGFQDWCTVWAREVYRVLNPGGHIVVFGSTRTFHRMACAIEDAGFEIRDTIMWLYGSGFPKSHDVSKGVDRAAGVERERYDIWNGNCKHSRHRRRPPMGRLGHCAKAFQRNDGPLFGGTDWDEMWSKPFHKPKLL